MRAVAERLSADHLGFYTEEVREGGRRAGFRIVTLDGRSAHLAHKDWSSPYRVGSYGVNLAGFESLALPLIEEMLVRAEVGLIDEIGKMECHSVRFRELVRRLFDEGPPILATVPIGGTPFIRAVKSREDTRLVLVESEERELWPARILEAIRSLP